MGIYISSDLLPGAAPVYDRGSKFQPVFNWDTGCWVDPGNEYRTYAPSIYRDTWKSLAAAVADGYLELIKKYRIGEMMISYCETKTGYRAALTFFPKGGQLTLTEIRKISKEDLGKVPHWFPVRNLNKGTALALVVMNS